MGSDLQGPPREEIPARYYVWLAGIVLVIVVAIAIFLLTRSQG